MTTTQSKSAGRYFIRCHRCHLRTWRNLDRQIFNCPECGTACFAEKLEIKAGRGRCNDGCEMSESRVCRCSCGGSNHGASL